MRSINVHGVRDDCVTRRGESLGTRPTVGGVHTLLEVHVFDFSSDLYGREIEVEFVAKLRDEEHFPTLDALVEQIHRDAAQARRILSS